MDLFIAMFKDLNADHVFDVTPGSGAAATAALLTGITYEGVAMNKVHENWLNRILDKAIFAVIADKEDADSKDMRTDVKCFFNALVDEARFYISSGGGDVEEVEEDEGEGGGPEE